MGRLAAERRKRSGEASRSRPASEPGADSAGRLSVYTRTGRSPRFIGPAPRQGWLARIWALIRHPWK